MEKNGWHAPVLRTGKMDPRLRGDDKLKRRDDKLKRRDDKVGAALKP